MRSALSGSINKDQHIKYLHGINHEMWFTYGTLSFKNSPMFKKVSASFAIGDATEPTALFALCENGAEASSPVCDRRRRLYYV